MFMKTTILKTSAIFLLLLLSMISCKQFNHGNQERHEQERREKIKEKRAKARQELYSMLPHVNRNFPLEADEGVITTHVSFEGDNFTYHCQIDENKISMDMIDLQKTELKETMFEDGLDSDIKDTFKMIIDAGMNLSFLYTGDTSGKQVEFVWSRKELRALLRDN